MVMRLVEMYEDDLEGGRADVTVSFGLDGASYEIDLTNDNAQQLRESLRPFVEAARSVSSSQRTGRRRSGGRSASNNSESPAKVREWARENGHNVNERGRIPASVVAAYREAHGG